MIDKENFERQAKNPFDEERERAELEYLNRLADITEKMGDLAAIIERFGDVMADPDEKPMLGTKYEELKKEADAIIKQIVEAHGKQAKP